ncbi:MAG: glycosyltransferase N-terminal domain-containing protein [Salegentibacter sp.]
MKLFVEGRKEVFEKLENNIGPTDKIIWFHAASLGEFEQAVPVIEIIRQEFPEHRILVTFFSPSGYENKKNHPLAEIITYLPLDTKKNACRFLDLAKPELAFFVKYEIWPNFLAELKNRQIRSFLISGGFRKDQIFFKSYGGWMRKALETFEYFFVQNKESQDLLNSIGFNNVKISGDTRFDRVSRQIEYDNHLEFVNEFLQKETCIVAGSTWPEDDALLVPFINSTSEKAKFIIAPHEIKPEKVKALQAKIDKNSVLFSEKEGKDLSGYDVLILDTIGLLSKVYSYADIAYVGGAAGKTGLHNILEPATFGIPIIIGENFDKFPEAKQLQKLAGLFSVASAAELTEILNKLLENEEFRKKSGMIAGHFINSNTGATRMISNYLLKNRES